MVCQLDIDAENIVVYLNSGLGKFGRVYLLFRREGRGSKITTPVLVARGGLERSNPATTTAHSRMGVKETHNFMSWK